MPIRKTLGKEEKKIENIFRKGVKRFMEKPEWEKLRHKTHPPHKIREMLHQVYPFLFSMNAANAISLMMKVNPEVMPIIFTGAEIGAFLEYLDITKEQAKEHKAYERHLEYEKEKLKGVV